MKFQIHSLHFDRPALWGSGQVLGAAPSPRLAVRQQPVASQQWVLRARLSNQLLRKIIIFTGILIKFPLTQVHWEADMPYCHITWHMRKMLIRKLIVLGHLYLAFISHWQNLSAGFFYRCELFCSRKCAGVISQSFYVIFICDIISKKKKSNCLEFQIANQMLCIQLTPHSWDWEISDVKWRRSDGREIQHQEKRKTHCHPFAIGLINSYWRILRNNFKKKSELLEWELVFQINFSNWSSNNTLVCILMLSKSLMCWGIHLKLIWGYI